MKNKTPMRASESESQSTVPATASTLVQRGATPGPWEVKDLMNSGAEHFHAVLAPNGRQVASAFWLYPEGEGDFAELEANARLIAAAPDLLEALKRAVETIRVWHNMGHYAGEADHVWALYQASPEMTAINAAIAKAEGR